MRKTTKILRGKSREGLNKLLGEKSYKLQELHFRLHSAKLKNVREIRDTRREIARIETILNSKNKQNNSKR